MSNNIIKEDRDALIEFLKGDPILTQSANVRAFEAEWSEWVGCNYSVFVNSGASANLITMAAIKELYAKGPDDEVIVPTLTWVSDIASVMQNGFKPVFVDIDETSLGMDVDQVISKLGPKTRAVFLTHVLGYNGFHGKNARLIDECARRGIPIIEDVCESHGATHQGKRLGSIGFASNFSFYYAHHMSTVEGGMVCTNDPEFHQAIRMLRSHGMVREAAPDVQAKYKASHPDLNPDFIFAFPAYNVRSTELNAVIGRSQLKRLDANTQKRVKTLELYLSLLDSKKYRTDFAVEGSVNYAFTLVLKKFDLAFADRVMAALREAKVEFRRGLSGGGSQVRQPFVKKVLGEKLHEQFPKVDHVHFCGWYIGNFPELEQSKIRDLCALLNSID